ncbi:MAG TPA: hypothetical protein ENF73_05250, partial [Proteobacteria bacterium]|nr:hypothetical protein [Pseudomonadota bacterium]
MDDDIADDDAAPSLNAPSDLTAEYAEGAVVLNWTDNSDNEDGFYIYREYVTAGEKEFEKIGEVGADVTTYVDEDFSCDNDANYYVTAFAGTDESDPSNTASPGLVICAPSDLTAEYTEFGVELNWTDNSEIEDGFYIYREYADKEFVNVGTVGPNITTFVDDTFECDREATYHVVAFVGEVESEPTGDVDTGLVVCAPTNLSVDAYYGDTLEDIDIELFWDDNSEIEDGYRIEMLVPDKQDWEELVTLPADSTSYSYTIDCGDYVKDAQYRV